MTHSLLIKCMASEGQRTPCFDCEFIIKTSWLGARWNIQYREIDISLTLRMRNKESRKPKVSTVLPWLLLCGGCALPTIADQLYSMANG